MSQYARRLTISYSHKAKPMRSVRRSKRVKLALSVAVHGKTASGEAFREFTRTLCVSAHGGLLCLATNVHKEQTIVVENKSTRKEQECRVVYVGPSQNGKCPVGVEFTGMAAQFWQVYFPPIISN